MEQIIKGQVKDTPAEDVEELILDNFKGVQISSEDKEILQQYQNLEFLTFITCGLKSLENFPSLPNLIKLDLSDNKVSGGLEHLSGLTGVMSITLANNRLENIEDLAPLSSLGALVALDLYQNPVVGKEGYRTRAFEMFEKLEILDGFNADGEEASLESDSDSNDEGSQVSGLIESDQEGIPEADISPQLPAKREEDQLDVVKSKEEDPKE